MQKFEEETNYFQGLCVFFEDETLVHTCTCSKIANFWPTNISDWHQCVHFCKKKIFYISLLNVFLEKDDNWTFDQSILLFSRTQRLFWGEMALMRPSTWSLIPSRTLSSVQVSFRWCVHQVDPCFNIWLWKNAHIGCLLK